MSEILIEGFNKTIIMVFFSTLFSVILGFIPAIALIVTAPKGLRPNKGVYKTLDTIINILRGFPFLILMVAIMPFTKLLVGKSIGTTAAIVPLTIAAAPFVARIIESALKEVDPGVVEAAKSFGASNIQIIFISGLTLTIISIIGYSAMAGTVGAGGLGDLAVRYGYQRYQTDVMIVTVVILVIIVQVLQSLGNYLYKKLSQ